MAIKIEFDSKFGDSYLEAYARIINIDVDYINQIAQVKMGIYKDESARNKKLQPLEIEEYRYSGDEFKQIFSEILADKEGPSISPLRNIYQGLEDSTEGGKYDKYAGGDKVFDTDFDTGKEIGKEEILKKAKAAVDAAQRALDAANDAYATAAEDKATTEIQIAALQAVIDAAEVEAKEAEAAYKRLLAAEETEGDREKLK